MNNQAVMPLIYSMGDTDKHVRQAAAESLGRLKDRRALKVLTRALKDQNKEVRQSAADAIGRIGGGS